MIKSHDAIDVFLLYMDGWVNPLLARLVPRYAAAHVVTIYMDGRVSARYLSSVSTPKNRTLRN